VSILSRDAVHDREDGDGDDPPREMCSVRRDSLARYQIRRRLNVSRSWTDCAVRSFKASHRSRMKHRMGLVLTSLSSLAHRYSCSPQAILREAQALGLEAAVWLDEAPLFDEAQSESIGQAIEAKRMSRPSTPAAMRMTRTREGRL
jgi:hypothetical protein